MIEYAFIVATIVLIVLVGIIALGSKVQQSYKDTANAVTNANVH